MLTAALEADYRRVAEEDRRLAALKPTPQVLQEAARLVAVHGLRADDAVQVGSGLAARSADPSCTRFLPFDHALVSAAAAEAFDV